LKEPAFDGLPFVLDKLFSVFNNLSFVLDKLFSAFDDLSFAFVNVFSVINNLPSSFNKLPLICDKSPSALNKLLLFSDKLLLFSDKLPLALASGKVYKRNKGFSRTIRKLSFISALAKTSTTMPFVKVWIHFVWSTKNRAALLTPEIRSKVFQHIRENASAKGIFIDFINGHVDHVHCLVSLGTNQTIENVMQLIKGESSFWINKNGLCPTRFEWQNEYFAVSVSETVLPNVRKYIANQEEHHRRASFDDELKGFLKRAGFERFEDAGN
jgi:putative transposase